MVRRFIQANGTKGSNTRLSRGKRDSSRASTPLFTPSITYTVSKVFVHALRRTFLSREKVSSTSSRSIYEIYTRMKLEMKIKKEWERERFPARSVRKLARIELGIRIISRYSSYLSWRGINARVNFHREEEEEKRRRKNRKEATIACQSWKHCSRSEMGAVSHRSKVKRKFLSGREVIAVRSGSSTRAFVVRPCNL